jgi:hypothetical protein
LGLLLQAPNQGGILSYADSKVKQVFEILSSRSPTLRQAGVDHPAARAYAAVPGFADEDPVSQQTAVHEIDLLICRDLAYHRVSNWGAEDVERYGAAHD